MNDLDKRWNRVGIEIARRMKVLGLTPAEVTRRSGVSFKTLQRYIAGAPIVRIDKRHALTNALEWQPDSIDRILRGEAPLLADLEERFARLEKLVKQVAELTLGPDAEDEQPPGETRAAE